MSKSTSAGVGLFKLQFSQENEYKFDINFVFYLLHSFLYQKSNVWCSWRQLKHKKGALFLIFAQNLFLKEKASKRTIKINTRSWSQYLQFLTNRFKDHYTYHYKFLS